MSQHFLGLFWLSSSCASHGMRTVSSMFFVLIATPPGLHDGACPFRGQSMFPHIVIHHIIREYDDDIPWICVPSRGFRDATKT